MVRLTAPLGPVPQPLEVEGLPRFQDHVGGVIGCRTVNAQPHRNSGVFQFQDPGGA